MSISSLLSFNHKNTLYFPGVLPIFIEEKSIPVNPLLRRRPKTAYYESIGCVICTTPILPGERKRAGRWRWQKNEGNDKECGLHFSI